MGKKVNIYYIKDDIVYLFRKTFKRDYLLRLSPPFSGIDRRIFLVRKRDLDGYNIISSKKAETKVNKSWGELEEEWKFKGKTYKVLNYNSPNSTYRDIVGSRVKVENNNDCNFYLGYNQGRVFLISKYPDRDRVMLYRFKVIDNKIYVNNFVKWTSTKNCKVIYEVLSSKILKLV